MSNRAINIGVQWNIAIWVIHLQKRTIEWINTVTVKKVIRADSVSDIYTFSRNPRCEVGTAQVGTSCFAFHVGKHPWRYEGRRRKELGRIRRPEGWAPEAKEGARNGPIGRGARLDAPWQERHSRVRKSIVQLSTDHLCYRVIPDFFPSLKSSIRWLKGSMFIFLPLTMCFWKNLAYASGHGLSYPVADLSTVRISFGNKERTAAHPSCWLE